MIVRSYKSAREVQRRYLCTINIECENCTKSIVNCGLDKIKTWFDNNSSPINYDKSKFLQFQNKNNNKYLDIKNVFFDIPATLKTNIIKYLGLQSAY